MSGFEVVAAPAEQWRSRDGPSIRPNEEREEECLSGAHLTPSTCQVSFYWTEDDQGAPPQGQYA